MRDVERTGFGQPHVAVDARALIKLALTLRRIDSNHEDIPSVVVNEICYVLAERSVPAHIPPQKMAVKDHHAVAEHALELDGQPLAEIALRDLESSPVPADAGGRVSPIQRLEAVIN